MQPPYHPLFVHFPIALYFLGVLLTLGFLWRRTDDYEHFAYWTFLLSWIAGIIASLVGLVDRGQLEYDDPRMVVLNQHITQAILFLVINGLVLYVRFRWSDVLRGPRRWWYVGLIVLGAITLMATGWYGGELVYGLQLGVR